MSQQSGTHRSWGVEQVYISQDLRKKLFVKYGVQLSSRNPLGGWVRLRKGQVLHLQNGRNVTAYMAQGFNTIELYELQKQLSKLSKKVAIQDWNPLISCAHAEVAISNPKGDGIGNTEEPWAPSEEDPSRVTRAANVMTCIGAETISGAIEEGKALWESATYDNITTTITNAPRAAWEKTKAVGRGVRNGFYETTDFVKKTWSDPDAAWSEVTDGFEKTKAVVMQVEQDAEKAIKGFHNLSPEFQDRIICDLVSKLAADKVLNLALAATGAGLAAALVKIALEVKMYARGISLVMGVISTLNGSDMAMADKLEKLEQLLKNPMQQERLLAEETATGEHRGGGGVSTAASVDLKAANAAVKVMSEEDKKLMLNTASQLSPAQRPKEAEKVLRRVLSKKQKEAVLAAHEVAPDKGFFTYTPADLEQKRKILLDAGFTPEEATYLMRRGLAGRMSALSVGAEPNRTPQDRINSGLDQASRGGVAAAAENYRLAGEQLLVTDVVAARRNFTLAANYYTEALTKTGLTPQRKAELHEDAVLNYMRAGQNQSLIDKGLVTSSNVGVQIQDIDLSIGQFRSQISSNMDDASLRIQQLSLLQYYETRRFLMRKFPDQFSRQDIERYEPDYQKLSAETNEKYGRTWRVGGY